MGKNWKELSAWMKSEMYKIIQEATTITFQDNFSFFPYRIPNPLEGYLILHINVRWHKTITVSQLSFCYYRYTTASPFFRAVRILIFANLTLLIDLCTRQTFFSTQNFSLKKKNLILDSDKTHLLMIWWCIKLYQKSDMSSCW